MYTVVLTVGIGFGSQNKIKFITPNCLFGTRKIKIQVYDSATVKVRLSWLSYRTIVFYGGNRIDGSYRGEVRRGDLFGAGGNLNIQWHSSFSPDGKISPKPPYKIKLFDF